MVELLWVGCINKMIKFQRRKLPLWVCFCNDVWDHLDEPPMLEFEDPDALLEWLNVTLDDTIGKIRIMGDSVLRHGGCIGWIR